MIITDNIDFSVDVFHRRFLASRESQTCFPLPSGNVHYGKSSHDLSDLSVAFVIAAFSTTFFLSQQFSAGFIPYTHLILVKYSFICNRPCLGRASSFSLEKFLTKSISESLEKVFLKVLSLQLCEMSTPPVDYRSSSSSSRESDKKTDLGRTFFSEIFL